MDTDIISRSFGLVIFIISQPSIEFTSFPRITDRAKHHKKNLGLEVNDLIKPKQKLDTGTIRNLR